MPLRLTIVSSANHIGQANKFFEDTPSPSVHGEGGLYRIQVNPPVEPRRRPCHSKSNKAVEIANSFRKLFGFDSIKVHPTIEHHSVHDHSKFVPLETAESAPAPNDGEMHIMPFYPIPSEYLANASTQPVHRHSHHRHHRLRDASFVERLSHALMMLGPWEGRAVAFVLGKSFHCW